MTYFSWAPVFNSFGSNNRTNAIRVPMNGGRCESRNADGSLNPYLPATLALAAGLEGIREELDPGESQNDNLYELSEAQRRDRGIQFLPQNLAEAVKAFAPTPSSNRYWAANCATNSSVTRARNGRPITSASRPGRSSAIAICSKYSG